MPQDVFEHPFWYPSKPGGFSYVMSDSPRNDDFVDWPSEMSFPSSGVARMSPDGPTDFGIGKYIQSFSDSIGGCNMNFAQTQDRGFAYKSDDVRDMEIKFRAKFSGLGSHGFSISACTGHHSGDGCCQGFAYMITTEVGDNPTSFRFRKEMWHVSYHDSPEGSFEHPIADFKIDGIGRYVGLGFCRYNLPRDGLDDAVALEVWFNPDPDNDPQDWTMLRRIIDKSGNGWGNDGDDCGGARDQVGTWSNAQNRFKTNATNGTIDFKAVTLREIDPFGSFDETPPPPDPDDGGGNPPPPDTPPPSTPTKVVGVFSLHRNINILRESECEGTGGGGGSGGGALFYDAPADNDKQLSDTSKWDFRTRLAQQLNKKASGMFGATLHQLDVPLKKVGSPAASPTITAVIWDKNNNVVYTSPTEIDPTTLTTSFTTQTFDFTANTHVFVIGDRVGIRYFADSSTSDVNYVVGGYESVTSEGNTYMLQLESGIWQSKKTRDLAATMYD